ncbi:actin cytoskeleton-regulatory complex protein PAN1 [Xyrichtys novacula]|nr:actin cytoskeleton-regulatory complex protein PAN1 [Xyrichtys novacula]
MSWDRQVSSLLSMADGSAAKIRERLRSPGIDLFPSRERTSDSNLDPSAPPPPLHRLALHREDPLSVSTQWSNLATLQSELMIQRQEIHSLTLRVITIETERNVQHNHIQRLQDEVQRLRDRGAEERRRETGELSSLRGHFTRATTLDNLEESLSSRLEHLRRDMELLKSQLRREELELLHLQEDTRESRRQGQHTCRTVEQMTDSLRSLSTDLTKSISDTQQEFQQIRLYVSQLKEELRTVRDHQLSAHTPGASPLLPSPHRRLTPEADFDSCSEDLSLTPSLAEVSSDDLSRLDHRDPADSQLQDHDDDDDLFDSVNPDTGSDLSLNDI